MDQNKALLNSMLNRTFFKAWKNKRYVNDDKYSNYKALEIQFNANCNLACEYCYYNKYQEQLYPAEISKPRKVIDNFKMLLDWLEENKLFPTIELFSGEPLIQPAAFEILDILITWYAKNNIQDICIGIPTNSSFIMDDTLVDKIEAVITKAKENNLSINLSLSDDGKYCSNANRPFKNGMQRDDEYYEKLFQFASKHKCAFHPMVYSNKIEKWKDNFLWFQENFENYKIPWQALYLLEVRNMEWTLDQIKEFHSFIKFVIGWVYNRLLSIGVVREKIPQAVFDMKLFNLFNIFSTMSRGIGCSIQSTMQLRLGDLTTTLCHRNAYEPFNLFKFEVERDKITGITPLNIGMMISMYAADSRNFPFCETCSIKNLCPQQCLGSMFEVNKDQFIPIPTVCLLEHAKISGIIDKLIELNMLSYFYEFTSKKEDVKLYLKYFTGDNLWN